MRRSRPVPCLCDQRGFTTIETAVALQVLTLIIGLAGGFYLFNKKIHTAWDRKGYLQQLVTMDVRYVAQNIRNARAIVHAGADELTLLGPDGVETRFHVDAGGLYRNSTRLTPAGITVGTLRFVYHAAGETEPASAVAADSAEGMEDSPVYGGALDAVTLVDITAQYHDTKAARSCVTSVLIRNKRRVLHEG